MSVVGGIVGACGTACELLASLGLGLTAALRVHSVPPYGVGSRLVRHTIRPEGKGGHHEPLDRYQPSHEDPKFLETESGTAICTLRIAVQHPGEQGHDGYFDVKCFDAQANAWARYLKAGREIAVDGRLLFR